MLFHWFKKKLFQFPSIIRDSKLALDILILFNHLFIIVFNPFSPVCYWHPTFPYYWRLKVQFSQICSMKSMGSIWENLPIHLGLERFNIVTTLVVFNCSSRHVAYHREPTLTAVSKYKNWKSFQFIWMRDKQIKKLSVNIWVGIYGEEF